MSDFENIFIALMIPMYGVIWYVAGRGNLGELIIKMLQEKIKEIEERLKENEQPKE